MPRESLVGNHGGAQDYLDAELWFNAESSVDYGLPIVALCKGDFGNNFTLSGTSVNGAEIKSLDATYNGSNDTGLAVCKSMNLQAVIDVHDVAILPSNGFLSSLTMNASSNGSTLYNIYGEHLTASGVDVITLSGSCPNSILRNSVLNGGVNGIDYGFNFVLNAENVTAINATGDGFEGAGSNGTLTDCIALNNGTNDYINVTLVNCASSDLTGSSGLTGYTLNELVDASNKDFRVKSTSPLAGLGAFTEASGAEPDNLVFSDSTVQPTSDSLVLSNISELSFSDATAQPSSDSIVIEPIQQLIFSDSLSQPLSDAISLKNITSLIFSDSTTQALSDLILLQNITELSFIDSVTQPTSDFIVVGHEGQLIFSDSTVQPVSDTITIELYTDLVIYDSLTQPSSDSLHLTTQVMPSFSNKDLLLIDNTVDYYLTDNTTDYRIK